MHTDMFHVPMNRRGRVTVDSPPLTSLPAVNGPAGVAGHTELRTNAWCR